MRSLVRLAAGLLILTAGAAPVRAQQHIVDNHRLAATLQTAPANRARDLAAIRVALVQPEVRTTAERLGLNLARVDTSLDTVSDRDAAMLADHARGVTQALVGGASTVTISTTTIIIGLLVLILIIVAVK
jgi:hypothetical protein